MDFDKSDNSLKNPGIFDLSGGEGGIRTHGTLPRTAVFKTAAFNHSATSPSVQTSSLKDSVQIGMLHATGSIRRQVVVLHILCALTL